MLVWDDKFSVEIDQFDDHHKQLLNILVDLKNSEKIKENRTYIKNLLFELVSYTKYHFTAEERILQKYEYPDFIQHKMEHEKLIEQVNRFLDDYSRGEKDLNREIFDFLKKWLVDHILDSDKKYSTYLLMRGVK